LVGPNDSTKTTLLDAIEITLSPSPYLNLSEVDFHDASTGAPIEVRVTIGDISPASPLWLDEKFGLLKRGWTPDGKLKDEPEDDGWKPILTVRLRVDDSYEPEWTVVADRRPEGIRISHRDRALFGAVRLGDEVERDLTWGRFSLLSRLTGGNDPADAVVAEAQRQLRKAAQAGDMSKLNAAARKVQGASERLGVRPRNQYQPGLDSKLVTFRQGAFALHDGDIPVRAAGLGTRRLTALAIQRAAVPEGAIVLIDEVEHGLEPYRIRRLLRNLRQDTEKQSQESLEPGLGQVIMTTHSAVPLLELDHRHIRVVRSTSGTTQVLKPTEDTQGVLRRVPAAFLARKVLLCEGATEVGLSRRLSEHWRGKHKEVPIEHYGVEMADGGGTNASAAAIALRELEYDVLYFGDSDEVKEETIDDLTGRGVKVVLWSDRLCVEQRIARDLPAAGFEELLALACRVRGKDSIRDAVKSTLRISDNPTDPSKIQAWGIIGVQESDLRRAFGEAAQDKRGRPAWFKSVGGGEALGKLVVKHLASMEGTDTSSKLGEVEAWCYNG